MNKSSLEQVTFQQGIDVVIGPEMRIGARRVFYVKNRTTLHFYRLGLKEARFLQLCDGTRTISEVRSELGIKFDMPISLAGSEKICQLLTQRSLMTLADAHQNIVIQRRRPRFEYNHSGEVYLRIANPHRLFRFTNAIPLYSWRAIYISALLLAAIVELYVVANLPTLWKDLELLKDGISGLTILIVIAGTVIYLFLHEFAHGAVCARFGGTVEDIGIMVRYGLCFAYCRLDDLVLLSPRGRKATVLAGVLANIASLAPFAALYSLSASLVTREVCAFFLLLFNLNCILNFLPILKSDGYLLVSVCMGRPELREEAFRSIRSLMHVGQPNSSAQNSFGLTLFALIYIGLCIAVTGLIGTALYHAASRGRWLPLVAMATLAAINFSPVRRLAK